jgi:hypothetical protein
MPELRHGSDCPVCRFYRRAALVLVLLALLVWFVDRGP